MAGRRDIQLFMFSSSMLLTDLLENLDLVEVLVGLLSPQDVFRLGSVSHRARDLLVSGEAGEVVWEWIRRRLRREEDAEAGMRDYGEYHARMARLGLEPACRECYLQLYGGHVRRSWRSGRRKMIKMRPDARLARDKVVCFDACEDFAVLGTLFGSLVIWRLDDHKPQIIEGGLEQRLDKVTIRHNKVITLQGGLVSVYSEQNHELFKLLYRKSFEKSDWRLFESAQHCRADDRDPYWLPDLSIPQLRKLYRAKDPVKYPGLQVTVSTTGHQRFAAVRLGEAVDSKDQRITFHNLKTGEMESEIRRDHKIEHLAMVHLMSYNGLLYIMERREGLGRVGVFHDMDTGRDQTVIRLSDQVDLGLGFYSLFTEHGLLVAGRQDPLSYRFCCFSYDTGDLIIAWTGDSEFGLCLADPRAESLVTPRQLNYLYTSPRVLVWSERTHRGASLVCHQWRRWRLGPGHVSQGNEARSWRLSSSLSVSWLKTSILVAGKDKGF